MIWNKLKIANKIKLLLVTMVLLVFALLAYTSYAIFSKALIAESDKEMTLTNHYREEQIAELLLESEAYMKDASSVLSAAISLSDQSWETLSGQLPKSGETYYPASLLYNGVSLGQQITGLEAQIKKIQPVFDQPGSSKVGQFVYLEDRLLVPLFFSNNAGETLCLTLDASKALNAWIKKNKENPEVSSSIVLGQEDGSVVLISHDQARVLTADQSSSIVFIDDILQGASSSNRILIDGQEQIASWTALPSIKGGVITQVPLDIVLAPVTSLVNVFMLCGAVVLLLGFLAATIFSNILVRPLTQLKTKLSVIGQGVLPEPIEVSSHDEVGQMSSTVNMLVEGLKRTAVFANKIGKGNFDAEFRPLSDQDTLGKALIEMRDSLQDSEQRDNERNWIVSGIAEIGQILRSHTAIETLGDDVVSYMVSRIKAVQGAFYLSRDDQGRSMLNLKACYAYNRKKHHKQTLRFGEGLAGQAAIEQATIYRVEIPKDYVTITSGLINEQRPNNILIVPLISNEQVFGVLEFAAFEKLTNREIRFVEETAEIIARTIFNITVNERTRSLLEESQKMAADLQEKQEDLRRNAIEMEQTQEELKKSNILLEEQVEEVNRTQKRMQVLLENASEVITIYEPDGIIRYISPSVTSILGYSPEELIGTSDIEHFHPKGALDFREMFTQLWNAPQEQVTIQFSYTRENQERIWLEATGKNMLQDPAINGFVVNTRDITERRRAEKEARMRGQMQALSENSPDIITRFSKSKEIFYINPIISTYTGQEPTQFLQRRLEEVPVQPAVIDGWSRIIDEVVNSGEKLNTEIDFPSELGKRVFNVNAIPEFAENNSLESVLLVLHDITSRKLIELDIQSKNKKITESINYAKRIQSAILPDNRTIKRVLKDSFILYKPKDVVSGDFPWFMQKGDDIYIAAVDCTGHGVPGALISLIGYFLLNDIVGGDKMKTPGGILTLLDEKVTKTLKQDSENSQTRDGMDVAFCKINLKKRKLEYAGAHRPLYILNKGELQEFKGDKFPIGGAQYKTRTEFTNHEIQIEEGDRIFFCSDGFPDQFNAENRKFSPKQIRELIVKHHDIPVHEMYDVFNHEFESWKGDTRQLDDVLMIGIGF